MPPKVIGPYRVLETIGSGGVGTVYRALDRRNNETVALKLLSTGPALDPRAARRLAREFETLYDLSHPNVVKVFDTGVYQGYPYLAMELVEGLTLRHYLALASDALSGAMPHRETSSESAPELWDLSGEDSDDFAPSPFTISNYAEETPSDDVEFTQGPDSVRALADAADEPDTINSLENDLPYETEAVHDAPAAEKHAVDLHALNRAERVGRLKDAMLQLCRALAYIHGHGLVHRDLKPSNVMVDEDRIVRLMDFGLAKFLADDAAVTADGRLVGTFRYMSPEQILGEKLDGRADLYSLGVILYQMLTGELPFRSPDPWKAAHLRVSGDPLAPRAVNPAVSLEA